MRAFLILCLTGLTLANQQAAAQTNPLFRNIPPDASTVYHINMPVLTAQLNWQDLTESFPVAKLGINHQESAAILKDPALAGIDMNKDMFIAIKAPSADSAGYATLILHLIDSAKFRAAIHKEVADLRSITIPNKGRIRLAGKGSFAAAWNKELAVLIITMPFPEKSNNEEHQNTPKKSQSSPNTALAAAKRGLAVIEGYNGSIYTTDPVFLQGFSDDAAIHIWADQGKGLSSITKNLFGSRNPMSGYLQAAQGSAPGQTLTSIRLEAGRITMKSSGNTKPENEATYAKFNSRPLNMDLQTRIPPGRFLGLVNVRFDPLVINDILNKFGVRHLVDSILTARNCPLDTILQAFNGDLQLVCMEPVKSPENSKPKLPMYFVTTIGNMSAFNRITAAIKSMSDSAGIDSTTGKSRNPLAKLNAFSSVQDNILVISGSKAQSDGWFSNTERRNTDFLTARMKNNPVSILVDLTTAAHFMDSMQKDKTPTQNDKKLLELLHMMDRLEISGGAVNNHRVESFMELKLIDSSPNSLNNFIKLLH
jgi:uncharacterized protein DUF4836